VPRKVHVNTTPIEEEIFKKKVAQIFVDKYIHQLQEEGFNVVSLDESFFFHDSLVRRVWIDKKRPIVRVIDSHKHSCIFGVVNIEGK
jgi:hypothetical protein